MTTQANEINIRDVGPIENVRLPVPDGGGVVVLRGRNGAGKTKALEAIEAAATGKGGLRVRDGQTRGEVEAFGVHLKVARATRRTGELEVETLDGRLNVADLVDPQIKSPDAADARRIKALVQLAGVKADPALFHEIAGGKEQLQQLVGPAATQTDDLITMAARIKRDLETAARTAENQAKQLHAEAGAARKATEGVDLAAATDGEQLKAALEQAITTHSAMNARAEQAERHRIEADRAAARLEELTAGYTGPSVDQARADEQTAQQEVDRAAGAVRDAEQALQQAKARLAEANAKSELAQQQRAAAEDHEALAAECRQLVAATGPEPVSQADLDEAAAAVQSARDAVERGAVARRAKEQLEAAEAEAEKARSHAQRAARLRDAAKGTDDVLSSVVARTGTKLRVEEGRLVIDTKRGPTYYAELSDGERWRIALDIAIENVGPKGLLVIPQSCWEGLDPANRTAIAQHVGGRGTVILTAEAAGNTNIEAAVYEPATDEPATPTSGATDADRMTPDPAPTDPALTTEYATTEPTDQDAAPEPQQPTSFF